MRKVTLYILNVLYALFGLLLFSGGVLYYMYVNTFTSLRNPDHYRLDFKFYWPQVIPFVACFAGLFVFFVSCCGCCSASMNHKGFKIMQGIFTIMTLMALITSAVLTMKYGDSKETDDYLTDALHSGFAEVKNKEANSMKMFSNIERWLECCGVESSSSYRGNTAYLPNSCCGYPDDSSMQCEFTSKKANDRHGCVPVVISYGRIALKALAVTAAITAFFGILCSVASLAFSIRIKRKPAVYAATDIETKKGLL